MITITTYNIYLHTLYCQNMLPFCANFYYTLNLSHKFSAKYQTLWWVPLCHYPAVKSYFPRGKLTFTAPSGVRFNFFVTLNEIIIFIQIKNCNERALSRLLPFDGLDMKNCNNYGFCYIFDDLQLNSWPPCAQLYWPVFLYCNKTYDNPVVITPIRKLKAAVSNLHNTGYVKNKNRERKVI